MSCVPYSPQRSRFLMLHACGWWKVLAPSLVLVGQRYVLSPPGSRDARSYMLQRCTLCGEAGGAVIRCNDCIREYHASCAWRNGHRFGFEIQPGSCFANFLRHSHANTTVLPYRSGIIVVTLLQPRSKARWATWPQSCVAKNMTRANGCCLTCARLTRLAR